MIEKIGHVKNPLTVIAIFAGIAEISGTIVLPFLVKENQETYIWFLMLFPFFLVLVFFLTLNFNHRTLYSPSDYKDEQNFVSSVKKATPEEQGDKLRREVREVEAELKAEQAVSASAAPPEDAPVPTETNPATHGDNGISITPESPARVASDVELAHKLAVAQLSKYLNIQLKTDVRIEISGTPPIVYDAFAIEGENLHAVDVKYLPTQQQPKASRFYEVIDQSALVSQRIRQKNPSLNFTLHLFVVTNATDEAAKNLTLELFSIASRHNLRLEVHTRAFNDLINGWQYG